MSEKERRDSPHTEHATSAREYWDRLTRSFNAGYVKTVDEKYAAENDNH